jgi:hypothetical protein
MHRRTVHYTKLRFEVLVWLQFDWKNRTKYSVQEHICDLQSIEGCTFAELIAAREEIPRCGRTMLVACGIFAKSANENLIKTCCLQGGWEFIVRAIVDHADCR